MSVETSDYMAMTRRVLLAAGKRAADGDELELEALAAMHEVVDQALRSAVAGQKKRGKSWAEIGAATGVTKQAAQQRWGEVVRA